MRYILFLFCAVILFGSTMIAATPETEFTGKFDSQLIPQTADFWSVDLMSPKDAAKIKFQVPLGPSDKMFAGLLYNPFLDRNEILFALVSPSGGSVCLYVDINHNKQLDSNEKFEFADDKRPGNVSTIVNLPMNDGPFHSFPMLVGFSRSDNHLAIWQTKFSTILGTVQIKGRSVKVAYTYNPLTKSPFFNQRWWGIDANGDGKVDVSRMSIEAAFSVNESRILKVGDTYVSTKRADLSKNEIILVEHPVADYKRVDLSMGAEMPDFVFAGVRQNRRHLSEFRGKYVLLYIWGALCDSCFYDLAYMRGAYKEFHDRGFEIIALHISHINEYEVNTVPSEFISVGERSVSDWIKQLYLSAYPIPILLDRNGKIISRGLAGENELGLRGPELSQTLRKLFP